MEQRKVLIIILSITIILAATVGVGLLLYYPRGDQAATAAVDDASGIAWDPSDFLRGTGTRPGLEPEDEAQEPTDDDQAEDSDVADPDDRKDEGGFAVTYGVSDDGTGDREPDRPDRVVVIETPTSTPTDASDDAVTERATGQDASTTRSSTRQATSTQADAAVRSAPRAEGSGSATTTSAAESRGSATATTTAARRSTTTRRGPALADQAYWVQIISSPNRATIDQARRDLGGRQMNTRVLTKEIGGTTYYRLRFGPFALRTEAEKYLDWVLELESFSDALIFVDYTTAVTLPTGS